MYRRRTSFVGSIGASETFGDSTRISWMSGDFILQLGRFYSASRGWRKQSIHRYRNGVLFDPVSG